MSHNHNNVPSLNVPSITAPASTPVCGVLSMPFPRFADMETSGGERSGSCDSPAIFDRRVADARARREARLEARQLSAARHLAEQAAKVRRVEEDGAARAADLAAHIDAKQRLAEARRREWLARRAAALADAQRRRDRARTRTGKLRELLAAWSDHGAASAVADGCRRLSELSAVVAPVLRHGAATGLAVPPASSFGSFPDDDDGSDGDDVAGIDARLRIDTLEAMLMADPFAECAACGQPAPAGPRCPADPAGHRHLQCLPAAAARFLDLTVPVLFPTEGGEHADGAGPAALSCLTDPGHRRAAARHLVVAHHVLLRRALLRAGRGGPDDFREAAAGAADWASTDAAARLALRLVRRMALVLDAVAPSSCSESADTADDEAPAPAPHGGGGGGGAEESPMRAALAALTALDVSGLLMAWDRFSAAAAAAERSGRARVVAGLRQAYVRAAAAERWRQHDIERRKARAAVAAAAKGSHCAEARRERSVAESRAELTAAAGRQLRSLLAKVESVGGAAAAAAAEAEAAALIAAFEDRERCGAHQDPNRC